MGNLDDYRCTTCEKVHTQADLNEVTLQTIRDTENGIGLSKSYDSVEEMFADMDLDNETEESK